MKSHNSLAIDLLLELASLAKHSSIASCHVSTKELCKCLKQLNIMTDGEENVESMMALRHIGAQLYEVIMHILLFYVCVSVSMCVPVSL